MICASCGERTEVTTCAECGASALLDGRYRLEGRVGAGGTGTTWRASTIVDGRPHAVVAVKELPIGTLDSQKARELVEREIRVLRELDHPAIPRYWEDLFVGKGRSKAVYLVQDFVDGETLAEELRHRRYNETDIVAIVAELLRVLVYLHGLRPPVVHRDLKPQNVIRRTDGRLALIDFGSVRDTVKGELGGSTVAGTFGYMAPEQFRGDAYPVSDLYGVGAIAVALLTRCEPTALMDWSGRMKWEGATFASEPLRGFLARLLAPDPAERWASAAEALDALTHLKVAQGETIAGPEAFKPLADARSRAVFKSAIDQVAFGPSFAKPLIRAEAPEPSLVPRVGKAVGAAAGMVVAAAAAVALVAVLFVASPASAVILGPHTWVHTPLGGTVICTAGAVGEASWEPAPMVLGEFDRWCTVHLGERIGGFHGREGHVWCSEEGNHLRCE